MSYAMTHERLTHARRKQQTRERLFEAARSVFLEKGLAATSVEDIVKAAGYTRGAFYSNFHCKEELLLELLRRDADEASVRLQSIVAERGRADDMSSRAIAYYSRCFLQSDSFPLWMEAHLIARRDSAFRERVNALRHEQLEEVSAYLRANVMHGGCELPLPQDAVALTLMSLCNGVHFLKICTPQAVSDEAIQSLVGELISNALRQLSPEKRQDMKCGSVTAPCV
ncbi:TetR/AcrR family transcriptional regulator [Paraburkholderia caledonica]|uniref:TetR/AcrR family transcriptional regulator n=2 Tax=Paraburkholderia caledonica TaxID=134536 RepID=UPI000AF3E7E1|nr:TetR/AcrR family transcriptional regulator [Paraburkholderia caledonica]